MSGEKRRQEILNCIKKSQVPLSGTKLAQMFEVSRQVIVQDIALLRASHQDIISTNRGYVCNTQTTFCRVFYVCHNDEEMLEELHAIVDCGGKVEDVYIDHEIYGKLSAELKIDSRKKVRGFLLDIEKGKSSPLKNITSGYHYHTVSADSEDILDEIEQELKNRNFLVQQM